MKNLIFVALIVSVMLVLTVGSAFAFVGGEGDTPADRNAEAQGSTTSSVEAGGESGGSGGPIVSSVVEEIWNLNDSALSFR